MDKINFNTPQLSYNFIYSNKDLIIEDKNIEKKFINYFGISLSLCKNKCNNIDDGKSYYESLNNCLIKNNCTEQLIGYNSINCKKDFQESINKLPSKFQNLITLNSEKICNNYKDK